MTTLRKSHDAMAKFLAKLCRRSAKAKISDEGRQQYDEAKKLIAQAKAVAKRGKAKT